ncbi:MAG: hypothetical protein HC819_00925 [Cyclobacteriaceae bacterium]|nr:hypothetical protein [Cyclobacteriaceae bacterium]
MSRSNNIFGIFVASMILSLSVLWSGCASQQKEDGKVIFTRIPAISANANSPDPQSLKYLPGMQIVIADMGTSPENLRLLSHGFFSARAPEVDFDGLTVVFSAQQNEGDIWQIWTLHLADNTVTQVTQCKYNCTDPAWLPGGRIAYSKQQLNEKGLVFHAIFSCLQDGTDEVQITFQPHEDFHTGMLNDGRLLVSSKQLYPEEGKVKYLAVHPDGTKAELFYEASDSLQYMGKAWETDDHRLVFVESGALATVRFNRPLHSRATVEHHIRGTFWSIFPTGKNNFIASVKQTNAQTYGLTRIGDTPDTDEPYYNDEEYHFIEPIVVMSRPVPKKLPSIVMTDRSTGYFICMDAKRSEPGAIDTSATSVQLLGLDEVLGETTLEEDGSFYIEVGADRPIRFQTLNEKGEVVNGPSSWMWLRPNERRGCVGCHEDREMAPPNVVPKAIEKAPFAMIK